MSVWCASTCGRSAFGRGSARGCAPAAGRALGCAACGVAGGPGGADGGLAALLGEPVVERLDLLEHDLGRRLRLVARRLLDLIEADRVAVLHGHLRELQLLPVADLRGAGDRRGNDGCARLESQPADAGLRVAEAL